MNNKIVMLAVGILSGMLMACGTNNETVSNEITFNETTFEQPAEEVQVTAEQEVEVVNHNEQAEQVLKAAMDEKQQFIVMKYTFDALEGNLTEDSPEREVCVYLPPSYYETQQSYPVVYYLHGFQESARTFISMKLEQLNTALSNQEKEFILVGVDGANQLGGSYYVNSPVTGNWEDYTVKETVSLIDSHFRTIPDSVSRGICGFSMGGFGALNLAMKYPDIYGAFLAMSPGLIADGDMGMAMESWANDQTFLKAYARAFSPDVTNTEIYGKIPQMSGTEEDNKIIEDWENGFGNIEGKIEQYLSLNKPLKAMMITYGDADGYAWIPRGCKYMAECLDKQNIVYKIHEIKGGHMIPATVIEEYMVPFFQENLTYGNAETEK